MAALPEWVTVVVEGDVGSTLAAQITGRIRELRQEQGIKSDRELGRLLGKSHGWLSGLLNGRQPYDLDDLAQISSALGTTVEHLLGIGAYATAAGYLPPPVQRLVDTFAESILRRYNRPGVGTGQRRALLRVVTEAWKYVERGMAFWDEEISRKAPKEPGFGTTPSRPARG